MLRQTQHERIFDLYSDSVRPERVEGLRVLFYKLLTPSRLTIDASRPYVSIPLMTHKVFRPVHMGRKTEWRCLPPVTITMMSSGLVERWTTPSGVMLIDSRISSSSLLCPLRRAGISENFNA